MQRYKSYKPSGVEWLGEIPTHWDVKRAKHVLLVNPSGSAAKSAESVTFLPMEAVTSDGKFDTSRTGPRDVFGASLTEFQIGDILLAKITPCFENGKGAYIDDLPTKRGIGSTEFHVFRPLAQINAKFIYYLLHNEVFRASAVPFMEGSAGQKRITTPFVKNLQISIPPRQEQDSIVNFLGQKTAEIDAAIAKKKRLIELLQQQKNILINQAVTRGLNPNVIMRDSGVDWIGEIPKHWDTSPLKHVSTVQGGVTLGKNYVQSRFIESYPYLRVANVQDGFLDLSKITEINLPAREANNYLLKHGDILVTEGGDIDKRGRGTCWYGEIKVCLHQNHIFAVRIDRKVLPEYVSLITGVTYARRYFTTTANKTTNLASTNKTKLGNLPLIVPPKEEQQLILEYCTEIRTRFEILTDNIIKEIAALKEMKDTLIVESVTGKLKV